LKSNVLQQTTARLEQEKIEFLKRRCESGKAKVTVKKQRLQNDSIRQQNEEIRLQIDVEGIIWRNNIEQECLISWVLLLRK
jgi:hypothetical protein